MHFTAIVASTVLALATGANAWAQAGNGVWTANNWYHTIRGGKPLTSGLAPFISSSKPS